MGLCWVVYFILFVVCFFVSLFVGLQTTPHRHNPQQSSLVVFILRYFLLRGCFVSMLGGLLLFLESLYCSCIDCKLDPKTQNDIVDMKNGTSTHERNIDIYDINETSMQNDVNDNDNDNDK